MGHEPVRREPAGLESLPGGGFTFKGRLPGGDAVRVDGTDRVPVAGGHGPDRNRQHFRAAADGFPHPQFPGRAPTGPGPGPALSIAPLAVVTQTLVELVAMVVLVRIVPVIVPEQKSHHLTGAGS